MWLSTGSSCLELRDLTVTERCSIQNMLLILIYVSVGSISLSRCLSYANLWVHTLHSRCQNHELSLLYSKQMYLRSFPFAPVMGCIDSVKGETGSLN